MFTFVSQGRKGRKAQTEKGYREGKHGGEIQHGPHSDNAILSVLGCENPCRECDPTEKPIPQLFEDVCKVNFFSCRNCQQIQGDFFNCPPLFSAKIKKKKAK